MRKPARNIFQPHTVNDMPDRTMRDSPRRLTLDQSEGPEGDRRDFEEAGPGRFAAAWDVRNWNIMGSLRRRKLLFASVSGLSMAALTAAVFLMPHSYTATTAVIFQGDRQNLARADDTQRDPSFAPDTLANEIELLLSDELLSTVATKLDLEHTTEFAKKPGLQIPAEITTFIATTMDRLPPWFQEGLASLQAADPKPNLNPAQRGLAETVATLRTRLAIGPVGTSRVIRIGVQARDPALAASIANTMAASYVNAQNDMKTVSTKEAHQWIEQRLDELRHRANASAVAYEALRHQSGLTRGKDGTISQEQITLINTELLQARQRRAEADAVLAQSNGTSGADLDQLASVSGSQLLAKLREQQAVATAKKAELESVGGAGMPSVVAIRAQVADINRSIAAERDRVRQTMQSKAVIARANEARLAATLEDLKAKVGNSDSSAAQIQALERDAIADRELYTSFVTRARQTDPDINYQASTTRVLSRATVPLEPASPNKRILLPVALMLSLGLGTISAVAKENKRRGLHSIRDVQGAAGQVSLGMLPWVRRRDRQLVRVFEEAVAQVLAKVLMPLGGPVPTSILVTSAMPREGKTNTSVAMAAAATARGLKVLLVDADLRRRSLSGLAGMADSEANLVRLLRGEIRLSEAVVRHEKWGFDVMPAGILGDSPMPLLGNGAWGAVLQEIELVYDLVVIDTPPVLVGGDTWLLAGPCDRTVMVSRWGTTPLATVELALSQLASARARIAGIVLTMVSHREHASYGYEDSVTFSPMLMQYHNRPRRLV